VNEKSRDNHLKWKRNINNLNIEIPLNTIDSRRLNDELIMYDEINLSRINIQINEDDVYLI
jgi:hypothetical protein